MDPVDDPLGLDAWPSELDRDAVGPALQAFAEVAGEIDDYELVITSDFENQVRARLGPPFAEAFSQHRGAYGSAMAKTLPQQDGRTVVVFDVRLFTKGAASPEATFRHEALHVLLNRNGENTFDCRVRLAEASGVYPDLVAMAGIAAEEYRVLRAVYERFPDDPWGSFGALCAASHDAIHEAAVGYYWDQAKNVQPIMAAVMSAFSAMTTQAGYVAAQLDVAGLATPALDDGKLNERILGEPWKRVVEELRRLPPADQRISRDELEAAVLRTAVGLVEWLQHMGFGAEVREDGTHYFHVYEHEDWVQRAAVQA